VASVAVAFLEAALEVVGKIIRLFQLYRLKMKRFFLQFLMLSILKIKIILD
jgi:hypothetical protein